MSPDRATAYSFAKPSEIKKCIDMADVIYLVCYVGRDMDVRMVFHIRKDSALSALSSAIGDGLRDPEDQIPVAFEEATKTLYIAPLAR